MEAWRNAPSALVADLHLALVVLLTSGSRLIPRIREETFFAKSSRQVTMSDRGAWAYQMLSTDHPMSLSDWPQFLVSGEMLRLTPVNCGLISTLMEDIF